jgi:hypothetical protein
MFATRALRNSAMSLLAADTTALADATPNKMRLAKNNFAPSENTLIGDIVEADFDGYAAKTITAGVQPEGFDPTTDASVIDLSPPAGGFRYASTGITSLPMTIYGYYVTDGAGAVLLASAAFPTPIVITRTGQVIDLGDARLSLPANSIT